MTRKSSRNQKKLKIISNNNYLLIFSRNKKQNKAKQNYGPKTKTPRKKAPQKTQLLRMGPRPKPQRRKNHQTLQPKKSQRIRGLQ